MKSAKLGCAEKFLLLISQKMSARDMAALASICVSTHTHTHSLLCEAMYSRKVPNQQRWWWFISLPSLFGVISINCFAGDKQLAVKTHMLYIWHITAGCDAATCWSYLLLLFFLARVLLLVLPLLFARYFLFVNHLCWPAPSKKDRPHLYSVFSLLSPSLFFSLFFGLPSVDAVGDVFFYIGVFEHQRRGAFTCVGALLLSSSVPAVSAQSSRL